MSTSKVLFYFILIDDRNFSSVFLRDIENEHEISCRARETKTSRKKETRREQARPREKVKKREGDIR